MPDGYVEPRSYWVESAPSPGFPAFSGELEVDVAIVGAGITGLTSAWLLRSEGKTVAVLEAKKITRGVTGYTTAKVTSAHGLIYADLTKKFGEDGARIYGSSQEAAIAWIEQLVTERSIDCDWERKSNYTYSESPDDVETLKEEAAAARRLGLPASFVTETPLPYPVAGAVLFENQAQFHPRRYLVPLAEALAGDGSHVFEDTMVTGVKDGSPCVVETPSGTIRAHDVIVASHLPFLDRGLFFVKSHPHRSYVVAGRIDAGRAPDGMFITSGSPTRSIRTARAGNDLLLLVGGEGHKTGQERRTDERYRALERFAEERFDVDASEFRWSTQDNIPVDGVPYVGRLTRASGHVFTATGFKKWGMTNGTVAALILADRILGRDNPWAGLYDAKRLKPLASASEFVKENANVAKHWIGDRLAGAERSGTESLAPGEGAIVNSSHGKVAAFRDDDGKVHALSPVCTHLGCIVSWNRAERTWDCPCHGSRFDYDGGVIQGPALKPLERKDVAD